MKSLLVAFLGLASVLTSYCQVSLIVSNGTTVNQSTYIATSYAGGGSFSIQASAVLSPGQKLVWNYGGFSGGASAWFNAGSNGVNVVAGVWTLGVPYTNTYTITPGPPPGNVELSVSNVTSSAKSTWIATATSSSGSSGYVRQWTGTLAPGQTSTIDSSQWSGGGTEYFLIGSNGLDITAGQWNQGDAYTNRAVVDVYHPPFWRVDFIVTNNTATSQPTYIATSYAGGGAFSTQWTGILGPGQWTNWIYDGFTGGGNAAWFNAGSNYVNYVAAVWNLGTGSTNVFYLGGLPLPPALPVRANYLYFKEIGKDGKQHLIILRGIKLK